VEQSKDFVQIGFKRRRSKWTYTVLKRQILMGCTLFPKWLFSWV